MKNSTAVAVLLVLAVAVVMAPAAEVPRKSPELAIFQPPSKTTPLSSYKGRVVVVEFLFLGSQHCLRVAQTLDRLRAELGPRGFQPIGIVFGPHASEASVYAFAQTSKLSYPIGYSTAADVDTYLARKKDEVLNIPQVVVIDRSGMIRAQSGGRGGDPKLEDEVALRSLVMSLLAESAAK
jgi:hypothetical protein